MTSFSLPGSSSLPGSAGIPEFHEVVFEALPTPIFVMDSGLGIIDFNSAAAELAESAVLKAFRPSFGEAVHCVEAESASCGNAPGCHACVIRNSVREAVDGAQVCRKSARLRLRREGAIVETDHLVTVAPFLDGGETLALLTLDDMNELAALIASLNPATLTRFAAATS